MGFLKRHTDQVETPTGIQLQKQEQRVTALAVFLGIVASIGGFMFGYVRYVNVSYILLAPFLLGIES